MLAFYDRGGNHVAYGIDCGDLHLYSGEPVGYLEEDSVYSFRGKHLGWYAGGWIRDHEGQPVFFTREANGFPLRPAMLSEPEGNGVCEAPARAPKEPKPEPAPIRLQWSLLSSVRFFEE